MKKILIDANVVISFLHCRIPQQQERAAKLISAAAERKCILLLHQNVLMETVYVLINVYRVSVTEAAAIIADLLALPGVERLDTLNDRHLLDIWPKTVREFGDAVITAIALEEKVAVATFDRSLGKTLKKLAVDLYTL